MKNKLLKSAILGTGLALSPQVQADGVMTADDLFGESKDSDITWYTVGMKGDSVKTDKMPTLRRVTGVEINPGETIGVACNIYGVDTGHIVGAKNCPTNQGGLETKVYWDRLTFDGKNPQKIDDKNSPKRNKQILDYIKAHGNPSHVSLSFRAPDEANHPKDFSKYLTESGEEKCFKVSHNGRLDNIFNDKNPASPTHEDRTDYVDISVCTPGQTTKPNQKPKPSAQTNAFGGNYIAMFKLSPGHAPILMDNNGVLYRTNVDATGRVSIEQSDKRVQPKRIEDTIALDLMAASFAPTNRNNLQESFLVDLYHAKKATGGKLASSLDYILGNNSNHAEICSQFEPQTQTQTFRSGKSGEYTQETTTTGLQECAKAVAFRTSVEEIVNASLDGHDLNRYLENTHVRNFFTTGVGGHANPWAYSLGETTQFTGLKGTLDKNWTDIYNSAPNKTDAKALTQHMVKATQAYMREVLRK